MRAARGLARRGRGARRRKMHPPGGGVFLNSGTNASSHNANASYARHSTRDAGLLAAEEGEPTSLREPLNPADPDPFRGSAFSRSVLVALGNKLLMKAALGVFAAGAALARARRAYCARARRRNAAAPARAALAALGDAARRARRKTNGKPTRTTDARGTPRRVSTAIRVSEARVCSSRMIPSS